jgi:hypothetical protein
MGLLDVAAGFYKVGQAISAMAEDVKAAAETVREARTTIERNTSGGTTTSTMPSAGGATGGLGSSNTPVTSRGMTQALTIARRHL